MTKVFCLLISLFLSFPAFAENPERLEEGFNISGEINLYFNPSTDPDLAPLFETTNISFAYAKFLSNLKVQPYLNVYPISAFLLWGGLAGMDDVGGAMMIGLYWPIEVGVLAEYFFKEPTIKELYYSIGLNFRDSSSLAKYLVGGLGAGDIAIGIPLKAKYFVNPKFNLYFVIEPLFAAGGHWRGNPFSIRSTMGLNYFF